MKVMLAHKCPDCEAMAGTNGPNYFRCRSCKSVHYAEMPPEVVESAKALCAQLGAGDLMLSGGDWRIRVITDKKAMNGSGDT